MKYFVEVTTGPSDGPYIYWYRDPEFKCLHREDGPAIECDNSKSWYKNGKLHREDGPAVIFKNGLTQWYKNGKLHREDGPAVIFKNGTQRWYINGIQYSENEFNSKQGDIIELTVSEIEKLIGKRVKII